MPMRPVNFTHYTPIIRFLAEPDRDLVLSPDVITRCRAAEWIEELCGGMYVSVCTTLRVYVRRAVRCVSSDGFNFHFPHPALSLSRWRSYRAIAAHLPMLTRNARGVYRFYRAFTDFIASVFTFRYNYTLMCDDRVGSGFA